MRLALIRLGLVLVLGIASGMVEAQMVPPQGPAVRLPMMHMDQHEPGHQHMYRHGWVMMKGIPETYHKLHNPLPASKAVIGRGEVLFKEHCVICHGPEGVGDGEAGKALNPRPTDLTHTMAMPIGSDPFLFWTLTEGGEKLGTDMPVFGEILGEEERWSVIHYLRAAFTPRPETEE